MARKKRADKVIKPVWNDKTGTLWFDGQIVKQFNQPAPNQRAVLNAFQQQGWPEWIANPLEPDAQMDDRQRLADTVFKLNRNQTRRLLRFRRDSRGDGLRWTAAASRLAA